MARKWNARVALGDATQPLFAQLLALHLDPPSVRNLRRGRHHNVIDRLSRLFLNNVTFA